MATLYITEFDSIAVGMPGQAAQIAKEPSVTSQKVTFSTAAASSAFGANTRLIRLVPSAACYIVFGDDPTADANDEYLGTANIEYWRGVQPGQKVSVYDGSS